MIILPCRVVYEKENADILDDIFARTCMTFVFCILHFVDMSLFNIFGTFNVSHVNVAMMYTN